jgi:hypothetical protein
LLLIDSKLTAALQMIIYSLKPTNSHSYDEISLSILKVGTPFVLSSLTYIFNKILQRGIFPDRLKFSEVKPLFKKGNRAKLYNCRRIHFSPLTLKLLKKIIYKRLYSHLNKNNVLVTEQSGFREKSSTEMATYTLLNNILSSLNNNILIYKRPSIVLTTTYSWQRWEGFYGISAIVSKLMRSYL